MHGSCYMLFKCVIQLHYVYRPVFPVIEMTAHVEFSCVLESAFLHDTSGGRVVDEEVRPQSEEALDIETVIDHCPECFSGDSTVPVRFGYPVADFGVLLPYRDVALILRRIFIRS